MIPPVYIVIFIGCSGRSLFFALKDFEECIKHKIDGFVLRVHGEVVPPGSKIYLVVGFVEM